MADSGLNMSVRTHIPKLILVMAILALALLPLGCGGSSSTTTSAAPSGTTTASTVGGGTTVATSAATPATTAGSAAAANTVTISGFAFSPASITVKVGDSVTWTNNDSVSHTVTADDKSFASSDLANGASFSFTFTKAGTFPYHCSIHPSMTATVVVQ